MPKTINVRIEDNIYEIFRKAAYRKNKTVASYIRHAALDYTVNEKFINDFDWAEISDILDKAI